MDWLTFTARIVEALAWPAAAVSISIIFHRQIRALLSRVKRGSFGGAELEFTQDVQELAEEVQRTTVATSHGVEGDDSAVGPSASGSSHSYPRKDQSTLSEAPLSTPYNMSLSEAVEAWSALTQPSVAVLQSWIKVETAVRNLIRQRHPTFNGRPRADLVKEVIGADNFATYTQLRALRNRVAHGDVEPTSEAASQFVAIARELRSKLTP